MTERFKCEECNRELRIMVTNYERDREYGIGHCEACLRDFEWEFQRGKLKYFRRYFHG